MSGSFQHFALSHPFFSALLLSPSSQPFLNALIIPSSILTFSCQNQLAVYVIVDLLADLIAETPIIFVDCCHENTTLNLCISPTP
jgi:hypothetical protein